tara:strand:- start:200 stop:457 length:258 start_codon:yes stop_codon:yes gene_type:complete
MNKVKKWYRIGNYECPNDKMSPDCRYLGKNMNNNSKDNVPDKIYPSKRKVNIFYNTTNKRLYNDSIKKSLTDVNMSMKMQLKKVK